MHPPLGRFRLDHTFYGRIAGGLRGTLLVNSLYLSLSIVIPPEVVTVLQWRKKAKAKTDYTSDRVDGMDSQFRNGSDAKANKKTHIISYVTMQYAYRGKRPYYAHLTGKRILWPNHWLHGDKTLTGYRLDNCLSMPKYKSVLSLQHFRQYRFSGGSAFVRNREQMPQ